MFALLVLAQHSQDAPSNGPGIGLIIGAVIAAIVIAAAIFFIFSRGARRSRGGVQPVPESRESGEPPFESIERDRG